MVERNMLRKSTLNITLAFIGTVTLGACSKQRDVYKSEEDCIADWVKSCEEVKQNSTYSNLGGRYYGPLYCGAHSSTHSIGHFTVPRGGFCASSYHSGS